MLGVDLGASFTKICYRKDNGEILYHYINTKLDEIKEYFKKNEKGNLVLFNEEITEWYIIGGGSVKFKDFFECFKTKPIKVDEVMTQTIGARFLLENEVKYYGCNKEFNKERYLVVSMGTGIPFILVTPEGRKHVGGSALGGGSLLGLANFVLKTKDFDEVLELAEKGSPDNVDLLLKDVYGGDYGNTLKENIAASSFAKVINSNQEPSRSDLAAALVSTICYSLGNQLSFVCQANSVDSIILVGGFLKMTGVIPKFLERSVNLFAPNVSIAIPANHRFAGALGASFGGHA